MADGKGFASFAHKDLLVSLLVPEGWTATEPADYHVRFFGPEQPEYKDYQPTWSIALHQPDGFGEEWFSNYCEQSLQRLQDNYQGFQLNSTKGFMISSLAEVFAIWYQWEHEPGLAFTQLQALIPLDRYRFYLVNAATLVPLADTYLPVFDTMLKSLRVLPAYPSN